MTWYKCDVTRPLPKKCILDLQSENGRAVFITTRQNIYIKYIYIYIYIHIKLKNLFKAYIMKRIKPRNTL